MPENTHKDNAQAKPKPKKRQPVKKHDPHAERLAATFAVLGCLAAGATGLMMYYHLDAPLVWTSFLMVVCFLIAIHFHWRIQVVKRLCIIVAVLVFLGCLIWQHRLTAFKSEPPSLKNVSTAPEPIRSPSPLPTTETRVFLDIEPEKLFAFFDRYNDAQAEELVKPYIAKWTDVSGRVSKVDTELLPLRTGDKELRYGINVFIAGKRKDNRKNTSTQAIFDNPRWIERAKVLKRDEDITVRGQIKLIWGFGFYLEHCEIVE